MLRRKPAPKNNATHRERNGGVKPFFRADLRADGILEIVIYEQIGEDFDWWSGESTGISAKIVKQKIDSMEYSSILLRINSPGGDAFEGVAILNLLRSQGKPVAVMIDGIAASAASIIAMAGTTIEMGSGAMMMIHNAWGFCMGNTHDMAQQANALGAIDKSIAQAYVDRTGGKLETIQSMMDAETWMGAEECVSSGFATGMQKAPTVEGKKALAMARTFGALSKFTKVPEKFKPTATTDKKDEVLECACDCQSCMDGECESCTNAECVDPNCIDCPNQAGEMASAHGRIEVMASMLRTAPAMEFQMHGGKTILALRKFGSAALNLVQGSGSTAAIARVSGVLAPYDSASCDLGGFCEVYLPGCFADSLKNDDPLILHTHNIESILGCKSAGTARFSDEADGLHYEVDLPDTQIARDLRVSMERGDIKGSSAAFFIDQYRWENRAGVRTRVIEKARLVEGGPHGFAAYSSSSAAVVQEPAVQESLFAEETVSNNEIEQLGARLRLLKVA